MTDDQPTTAPVDPDAAPVTRRARFEVPLNPREAVVGVVLLVAALDPDDSVVFDHRTLSVNGLPLPCQAADLLRGAADQAQFDHAIRHPDTGGAV